MKLKKKNYITINLTNKKLIELRYYLGLKKLTFFYLNSKYIKGFRNNFSVFELSFSKSLLKKSFKVIYNYHINKQKILFVSFSDYFQKTQFKSFIYKHKHFYLSNIWFNDLLSNRTKIQRYFKKTLHNTSSDNFLKNLSFVNELLNFSKTPDLIVLFFLNNKPLVLKEIERTNKPSIIFANSSSNLNKTLYKMVGNFNNYKANFFLFLILKSMFSISSFKKTNI